MRDHARGLTVEGAEMALESPFSDFADTIREGATELGASVRAYLLRSLFLVVAMGVVAVRALRHPWQR